MMFIYTHTRVLNCHRMWMNEGCETFELDLTGNFINFKLIFKKISKKVLKKVINQPLKTIEEHLERK